jgi:hypothetical protein
MGLGAQATVLVTAGRRMYATEWQGQGAPAVRKAPANIDHLGAHGTEGPFLALMAGAKVKHLQSELDLEPANCLD